MDNPTALSSQKKLLLAALGILVIVLYLASPQVKITGFGSLFFGSEPLNGAVLTIISLDKDVTGISIIAIASLATIVLPIISAISLCASKRGSLFFPYATIIALIALGITFVKEDTIAYGWWLTTIAAIAWCVAFTILKRKTAETAPE